MGPKERLNIYLSNLSDEPFHWGVNDCFTFTNGAFRAMYGFGYADDWMGRYMNGASPKNATSMRREFKHSTLFCGLASKLVRSEQPVFGSLVLILLPLQPQQVRLQLRLSTLLHMLR